VIEKIKGQELKDEEKGLGRADNRHKHQKGGALTQNQKTAFGNKQKGRKHSGYRGKSRQKKKKKGPEETSG